MRVSPQRTRPSSTVRVSQCCQYGHKGQGTAFMSSGQPVMIVSARVHISGHSQSLVGMFPSTLGTGKHGEWQCPMGCQGQDMD